MKTFKISGHLCDWLLSNKTHSYEQLPANTKQQIMDTFNNDRADSMELNNKCFKPLLTQSEYKLILSLLILLQNKSENTNRKSVLYYAGTKQHQKDCRTITGKSVELLAPEYTTSLFEIAKTYSGGKNIGGVNLTNIKDLLIRLTTDPSKQFVINYEQKNKGKTEYEIMDFSALLKINGLKDNEPLDNKQSDRGELKIILHPIFVDAIRSKYIDVPMDILKSISLDCDDNNKSKSSRISTISIRLILEMSRAKSTRSTKHKYKIGKTNLINKILDKYRDAGGKITRPAHVDKLINESIELVKNIELITDCKIIEGKTDSIMSFIF